MFGFPFTGMFTFLFIVFICLIIYKAFKADSRQLQNNWSQYLDGMRFQTLEFYERLKKELQLYDVKHLEVEQVSVSCPQTACTCAYHGRTSSMTSALRHSAIPPVSSHGGCGEHRQDLNSSSQPFQCLVPFLTASSFPKLTTV
jgi:hypothetical protein